MMNVMGMSAAGVVGVLLIVMGVKLFRMEMPVWPMYMACGVLTILMAAAPVFAQHSHAWLRHASWYQEDVEFCTWVCHTSGYQEHFMTTNGAPTCSWPH